MTMSATERPPQVLQLEPAAIEEIASRLVNAVLERVVEAIRPCPTCASASANTDPVGDPTPDQVGGLWTTRQVAAHYGVTLSFVYQHADELDCIRLGGGTCARLRFDPRVVRERWAAVGQPATPRPRSSTRAVSRHASRVRHRNYELLDFDREP